VNLETSLDRHEMSASPHSSDGSDGYASEDTNDSDLELQVALKAGLLKGGINVVAEKKRQPINKEDELSEKLFQIEKKRKWIDTLDVTFAQSLSYEGAVDQDFERESAFVRQAQSAIGIALPRLQGMKVPVLRPADYFAEMAKSDGHMQKIRKRLLDIQKEKEGREKAIRLRGEKKFAVKVQKVQEERKHVEKRKLMEAVKKHRKGMKGQLDSMLNNAQKYGQDDEDEEGPSERPNRNRGTKMHRNTRDKMYGFGGRKKGSKKNDKKSFESSPFGVRKKGFQQRNAHKGGTKGGNRMKKRR